MKLYEYLSSLGIEDWLLQLKYARSIRIIFNVCFWPESVGPTRGRPTKRYIPLVPLLAVSSRYQRQNYMVWLIMLSIFIRRGHGLNCQHWLNSESSRVKGLNLVRGTWRAVWFSRSFCREKWHIISHPNEVKRVHNCSERGFVRSENKGKIQVPMRFFGGNYWVNQHSHRKSEIHQTSNR